MTPAWVGLGANLGDAPGHVAAACEELACVPDSRLLARSRLYRSAPVGPQPQPEYVNAVAAIATALAPTELLAELQAIEARHGRVRGPRWGPRTLDLDLLLYDDAVIATPELTVPHPRIAERAFVLVPLAEIAPGLEVPGAGAVAKLLARLGAHGVEVLADG